MFFIKFLILLFLSAFFSGTETALTSLSDYKVRKLYNKYKWFRAPIKLWVYRPYRFIIAILIGNTLVNLLLSESTAKMVLESSLNISKELKEFLVWLVVTVIIIIFGELTPKILCKNFPEKFTKIVLLPIYIIHYIILIIFIPLFFIIERYIKRENTSYFTKVSELRKEIVNSARTIFHKDVNELFERAMKFSEVRIKDIMTQKNKVEMVNIANKNITTVMNEIIETGKTRVPLYDGDNEKIIGFALAKDLFYLCSLGSECNVQDIIHPILEMNANTKAKDAIKDFKRTQIHIAKVVDDNKKFIGIITLEDIIEEVVGDILDEYDIRTVVR